MWKKGSMPLKTNTRQIFNTSTTIKESRISKKGDREERRRRTSTKMRSITSRQKILMKTPWSPNYPRKTKFLSSLIKLSTKIEKLILSIK